MMRGTTSTLDSDSSASETRARGQRGRRGSTAVLTIRRGAGSSAELLQVHNTALANKHLVQSKQLGIAPCPDNGIVAETGIQHTHQGRLITAIRDTAVGVLDAVQKLKLHGKAKASLPTAMRVAAVRTLFSDSKSDQASLEVLDH